MPLGKNAFFIIKMPFILSLTYFLKVKVWFQNRRTKFKREKMESGEAVPDMDIDSPIEDVDDE